MRPFLIPSPHILWWGDFNEGCIPLLSFPGVPGQTVGEGSREQPIILSCPFLQGTKELTAGLLASPSTLPFCNFCFLLFGPSSSPKCLGTTLLTWDQSPNPYRGGALRPLQNTIKAEALFPRKMHYIPESSQIPCTPTQGPHFQDPRTKI